MTEAILDAALAAIRERRPAALVTEVAGPRPGAKALVTPSRELGSLGDPGLDRAAMGAARSMLAQGATGTRLFGPRGEERGDRVEIFVQSFAPPPLMYVFGAIDFSRATVRIGKLLGYRVTVCDARSAFATRERFPEADRVVTAWPHQFLAKAEVDERTVLCVLTHDPKFDVPLLKVALRTPAGYIGAMGSRRTHESRMARLAEEGVSEAERARVRGPIGLDLGARTPEEVAVAIAAEIVALRYRRQAPFLCQRDGPVHQRPGQEVGVR